MGGSGSGTLTTEANYIPDYAQDEVEDYLSRSLALSLSAYSPYTGSTYAAQDSNELAGITAIKVRASGGSSMVFSARAAAESELEGDAFNANPKANEHYAQRADAINEAFLEQTLPAINSQARTNRFRGSRGHFIMQAKQADVEAARLAQLGESVYYDDYMKARERQRITLGAVPALAAEAIKDAEMLRQAGLYQREYLQGYYQNAYQAWLDGQVMQVRRLEILGNAVRAIVGAQSERTEPISRVSPFTQVAALAIAGAGLISTLSQSAKAASGTSQIDFTAPSTTVATPTLQDVPQITMGGV